MRYFLSFLLLVSVVYFGFIFFFDYSIESPNYEVVQDLGSNVEVRQYGDYYQAYVSYEDGKYENQAFRKLFNFISGENSISGSTDSESLDMTAPVKLDMTAPVKLDMTAPVKLEMTAPVKLDMTAPVKLDMTAPVKLDMTAPVKDYDFNGMAFVMPNDFDPNIIPYDSQVEIQKIEGQKLAVIRYSGFMGSRKMKAKYSELVEILDLNNIDYNDGAVYAAYNGPYTLPFLRRNEVWVQIK